VRKVGKIVCFDKWAKKNWTFKGKLANTCKLAQVYMILASLTELTRCKIVFSSLPENEFTSSLTRFLYLKT
jgi:hypothetical protein